MPLRFTPQGGWSLVDGNLEVPEQGVWSDNMSACEPLFVSCPLTNRVAMCHVDMESRLINCLNEVISWCANGVLGQVTIWIGSGSDLAASFRLLLPANCTVQYLNEDGRPSCGMSCNGTFLSEEDLGTRTKDDPEIDTTKEHWQNFVRQRQTESTQGFFSFRSPYGYLGSA
jgi:hypothetical protein